MKLLVISQYYAPEPFRVHDLCAGLVELGHEVRVVTGMPNYPKGELYPGFEDNSPRDEVKDGVQIHRCPIHPRGQGTLHRLWNYYSFPRAAEKYLRALGEFDAVLVYQLSPVMMIGPGARYAKQHRAPLLVYSLDLWPESLLAGGVKSGSALYRYYHRVSGKLYRAADRLLMTSEAFRDYFKREFGIPDEKLGYLPQYAERIFQPLAPRTPDGTTELCFAGNLGAAQDLGTVLEAARLLRDEPVRFTFVGDGTEAARLRETVEREGLDKVRFLGRRPVEEMPAVYAQADAMLVTLEKGSVLSLTLPGKVQSYLAAGKPVIGAIDGEAARVIREADCGFRGPAGDAKALAENIRRFMACDRKEAMGRNAAVYYGGRFTRNRFLRELNTELRSLTEGKRP